MKTVLISGAGIAGPTLAFWLARNGFRPTVVERSTGRRSSGAPVDVRGAAVAVADRMGIMPSLRAAATDVTDLSFVDASGKRVGRINSRALRTASGSREVELPRGDLASILYEASRDDAEYLFDESVTALDQDGDRVHVTFSRAGSRDFDFVVGTDGLHSAVRRLAFGPDADFVSHLGMYVATTPFHGHLDRPRDVVMHNAPGRLVALHPSQGRALAFFCFRGPAVPDFDHRDTKRHKRLLLDAFADVAWRVPELLETVRATGDLYFDSVSRVTLDSWANGRIALLGDAASSVSLFGDGSSLAMAGAYTLATELAATPEDHHAAFRRYERAHRVLTDPKQRNIGQISALLIPNTGVGIAARNLATRLWPVGAGAGWVRRRFTPTPRGAASTT